MVQNTFDTTGRRNHCINITILVQKNSFHVIKHVNIVVNFIRKRKNIMFMEKGICHIRETTFKRLHSSGNLPEGYQERYEEIRPSDRKAYFMRKNIYESWKATSMNNEIKYWNI